MTSVGGFLGKSRLGAFALGGGDPSVIADAVYPPGSWEEILREQGMPLARVTRMVGGVPQVDGIEVLSGSVRVSLSDTSRRACGLELMVPWTEPEAREAMDPFSGAELLIEGGVRDYRKGEQWWALAVMVPDGMEMSRPGVLSVRGGDRTWHPKGRKFLSGWAVNTSVAAETLIGQILAGRLPGWVQYRSWPTAATVPAPRLIGKAGDDPWASVVDCAKAAGCEIGFDRTGEAVLTRLTEVAATQPKALWYLSSGDIDELVAATDWNEAADGCIVTWDSGRVVVVPDDQRKYYVTYSGDASLISTQTQAIAAGRGEIVTRGRGSQSISGRVAATPHLDVGDVVVVAHELMGVQAMARLASLEYTLGSREMAYTLSDSVLPWGDSA